MREPAASRLRHWLLAGALLAAGELSGCSTDEGDPAPFRGDAGPDASDPRGPDGAKRPGAPPHRPVVGTYCRSDEDCGAPFTCLASTSDVIATAHGLGGPSNGVCSAPCDAGNDSCSAAENPTECVELSLGRKYCLPACTPGGQGVSPGEKCLGRLDLACAPPQKDGQSGFCSPTCGGSFECAGRTCDLGSGACVDRTPPGLPVGGDCSITTCGNGTCETLGLFQACTGFCTVGTVGCGFDPLSRDKLDSYCVLAATREGSVSDIGLCAQLCDCNDDCRHPRFVCARGPANSPATLSVRGHAGACLPAALTEPGSERGIPCNGGLADASAEGGGFGGGPSSAVPGSDR